MVTFTIVVTIQAELWRCCPYTVFLITVLSGTNLEDKHEAVTDGRECNEIQR